MYISGYGIGRRKSASGVASARNGAIARSPASPPSVCTINAMMISLPCASGGMNGIGGATITFAIVESSSRADSA